MENNMYEHYNRKMFNMLEWKQYNDEFNKYAGGFKYRWGDCEVISFFYYIYLGDSFCDLDLKEKGFYSNALPNTQMIKNGLL